MRCFPSPWAARAGAPRNWTDLGCERMREEEFERAARLFERSLQLEPERDEVRALYATALELCGRHRPAVHEMRAASEGGNASVRTLCMAAQFYHMARMPRKSRQMALRAVRQHPDGVELRMLIHMLGELGLDARGGGVRAPGHAGNALRPPAFARARRGHAAHGRAACAGGEILGAHRPHRSGGQRRRLLSASRLGGDAEQGSVGIRLSGAPAGGRARASAMWRTCLSAAVRRSGNALAGGRAASAPCSQWCLTVENPQFRRAAVTALAALNDPEAEATLREVFTRPEISYDMKLNALVLLRLRGADMRRALPPSIDERDGLLPDADATPAAPAHRPPAGLPLRLRGAGGRLWPQRRCRRWR